MKATRHLLHCIRVEAEYLECKVLIDPYIIYLFDIFRIIFLFLGVKSTFSSIKASLFRVYEGVTCLECMQYFEC